MAAGSEGSAPRPGRASPPRPGPCAPHRAPTAPGPALQVQETAHDRPRRPMQGPARCCPKSARSPRTAVSGRQARAAADEPLPERCSPESGGAEITAPSRPYLGSAFPTTGPGCLRSGGKTFARHHHRRSKMADMAAPASPPLPPPTCQSPLPGTALLPCSRPPIGRCVELGLSLAVWPMSVTRLRDCDRVGRGWRPALGFPLASQCMGRVHLDSHLPGLATRQRHADRRLLRPIEKGDSF